MNIKGINPDGDVLKNVIMMYVIIVIENQNENQKKIENVNWVNRRKIIIIQVFNHQEKKYDENNIFFVVVWGINFFLLLCVN